nr:tumor necrosis factor receptor superfamily member 27 isoform X2 [Pogona vitticeps]
MQEPALMLLLTVVTEVPQLLANPTDCRENEYLDEHGQCQPCKECGPGLELSKECGYGEGSQAQCVPCHPRRFKAQWGHHGCKPCLWCALINRTQKSNCTATTDAACGECLPGFYSKTQIRGLQDLECVPCTKQTPSSELQCRSKMRLVKVESPPAPATDLPLGVLTSSALVILALVLLTVSVLYCQRFWKDHGQRDYNEAVQYTPNAEVSGLPLPCHRPDVEFSNLITLGSTAPLAGNLTEAQPLIRDSGCSDCSAGGSSLAESRQDPAGDPGSPAPLSSCATERQHRWPHTPVECTELDLQTFSTQTEFVDTGRNGFAQRQLRGEEVVASAGPACSVFSTGQEKLPPASAQEPFLSFRNPAVESGEQLGEDVQSLVAKIGDVVQDLSIASLPDSLVLSLALQLDPSLPGLKNFIHLGMELGVPSHQLSQMSSFTDLVAYLSDSGRPLPTAILARALQTCQRFDALLLLYDHFTGSPIENVQS